MNRINKFIGLICVLLFMTIIYGRILHWIDKRSKINRIARRLMNMIPWDFEEIKSSLLGLIYYVIPFIFTAILCIYYKFDILSFFRIKSEYVPYIVVTIMGELSVVSMFSGCLTLISPKTDWSFEISKISWITSIKKRHKKIAPFVPAIGAFFEEIFFRGIVFLLIYFVFPEFSFLLPFVISTVLFSIEQVLFTQNRKQALSMFLGSLGVSVVACISIIYTGSMIPCIFAHETFVIFYFGKFKLY